jgi:transposase
MVVFGTAQRAWSMCGENTAYHGQNERAIAMGRKNWLFAGLDKGGERIANILTIIETVKLHGQNPEVYLTDVLARIQDHPKDRIEDLLPWNWTPANARCEAA